jgi:putative ABC transport system permease protein
VCSTCNAELVRSLGAARALRVAAGDAPVPLAEEGVGAARADTVACPGTCRARRSIAQVDAKSAFDALFLGLGAVALLVGAVGVANIMVISVLERRSEIGLRRALGATKGHVRIQFLSEAILLALAGGAAGIVLGAASVAIYAHAKGWAIVIPADAWAGGLAATLLIGAAAGLLPALKAARLSPTQALWTL